jgi:excisionase family DNA binding protein
MTQENLTTATTATSSTSRQTGASQENKAPPKRLLSVAEAARHLGISESAAYRLAASDALPGLVRLPGARMRVRARVLEAWLSGEAAPTTGTREERREGWKDGG